MLHFTDISILNGGPMENINQTYQYKRDCMNYPYLLNCGPMMINGAVSYKKINGSGISIELNKDTFRLEPLLIMTIINIDLYAEQWSKREQVDLKYLSEWKDQIKELVVERISSLKEKILSPKQKILSDPDVKDTLRRLHDDFVLVPADKAANNVIVVCKKYYIETLIKELGINTTNISPNSTYIPSTDSFHEILKSHCKFIESVGLEMSEEGVFLICTELQNYIWSLSNIALLLAPVNVPQKICHAYSPKC